MGGREEDVALIRRWFQRLTDHVQAVDYAGARPLFAEDLIAFGTFADFVTGRDATEQGAMANHVGHNRPFSLPSRRHAYNRFRGPAHCCGHDAL
jgi:hypothetical protein